LASHLQSISWSLLVEVVAVPQQVAEELVAIDAQFRVNHQEAEVLPNRPCL